MLVGPPPGTGGGHMSRSFFLGLLLFLLFFSSHSQPRPAASGLNRGFARQGVAGPDAAAAHRESVKEKIVLDLSVANERLEGQVRGLEVEVVRLRQALKAAGVALPAGAATGVAEAAEASKNATAKDGEVGDAAGAEPSGATPRRAGPAERLGRLRHARKDEPAAQDEPAEAEAEAPRDE